MWQSHNRWNMRKQVLMINDTRVNNAEKQNFVRLDGIFIERVVQTSISDILQYYIHQLILFTHHTCLYTIVDWSTSLTWSTRWLEAAIRVQRKMMLMNWLMDASAKHLLYVCTERKPNKTFYSSRKIWTITCCCHAPIPLQNMPRTHHPIKLDQYS